MSVPAVKVSFEFFPPGDDATSAQLWNAVQRLAPLEPSFVSVTYGADGSTRSRTHQCVMRILRETSLRVAPHLTCVGATREEILSIARELLAGGRTGSGGVAGRSPTVAMSGGLRASSRRLAYASDLVRGLRDVAAFDVSVAAYPEGHPETPGVEVDLANLKRKIDAGAQRAITQFFSTPMHSCAIAIAVSLPASPRPSSLASCPSRAFRSWCDLPSAAAPRSPRGCGSGSTVWMTIRRHGD